MSPYWRELPDDLPVQQGLPRGAITAWLLCLPVALLFWTGVIALVLWLT